MLVDNSHDLIDRALQGMTEAAARSAERRCRRRLHGPGPQRRRAPKTPKADCTRARTTTEISAVQAVTIELLAWRKPLAVASLMMLPSKWRKIGVS